MGDSLLHPDCERTGAKSTVYAVSKLVFPRHPARVVAGGAPDDQFDVTA
jgi:hypothetical protein